MGNASVPGSYPSSNIARVSLDYETGSVAVLRTDGALLVDTLSPRPESSHVKCSTFFPSESRMEISVGEETVSITLGTVNDRTDLPVVYLDQNHWIDFARWRKGSDQLSADTQRFYETLAEAALQQRVIVPLSSAHLAETSKRGGLTRLDLASTMLTYSAGWQMRSVLALRRAELRVLFELIAPLERGDVFTLAPEAILDMNPSTARADLGDELGELVRRQTWATTLVSLLLDSEPDEDAGGEAAHNWAQSFRGLADAMKGNERAKQMSRDLTRMRFISDLGEDFLRAASTAMPSEDFPRWMAECEYALSGVPALGRVRELMHLRITNSDDKWEAHDLNDMMFLSYAAGYADLVIGEKKMINLLKRCDGRVSPGAKLHRRADQAQGDLDSLLAVGVQVEM